MGYTMLGEDFTWGPGGKVWEASAEDKAFQEGFWELATELVADGRLTAHSPEVRGGGLQGVLEGLDDLRTGRVSGKKLVYRIGE